MGDEKMFKKKDRLLTKEQQEQVIREFELLSEDLGIDKMVKTVKKHCYGNDGIIRWNKLVDIQIKILDEDEDSLARIKYSTRVDVQDLLKSLIHQKGVCRRNNKILRDIENKARHIMDRTYGYRCSYDDLYYIRSWCDEILEVVKCWEFYK